mgnify:CR=1 FL=1
MGIDLLFVLATAAFGWGLSLATYRMVAKRRGWPMGHLHAERPAIPVLLGILSLVAAFLFAAARSEFGGWAILVLGLIFAAVWTGVFRVASQTSLLLAPLAALLLALGWFSQYLPTFPAVYDWRQPRAVQPAPLSGTDLPGAPRPKSVETMRIEDQTLGGSRPKLP